MIAPRPKAWFTRPRAGLGRALLGLACFVVISTACSHGSIAQSSNPAGVSEPESATINGTLPRLSAAARERSERTERAVSACLRRRASVSGNGLPLRASFSEAIAEVWLFDSLELASGFLDIQRMAASPRAKSIQQVSRAVLRWSSKPTEFDHQFVVACARLTG
jgi:hypothetical protein